MDLHPVKMLWNVAEAADCFVLTMMHIEKRLEGWTVVNDAGEIRLHTEKGVPMYLETEEEVVRQCNANGMYRAGKGNPGGWPEGTLLELSVEAAAPERERSRS